MSNIKVDKDLNYKRRDLEVSNSDERPLKTDYDRYVTLRDQFRDVHYDPHKLYEISDFNVVDVGFNALFLKANKDLLTLAKIFDLNFDDLNNFVSKTENQILKLYDDKINDFVSKDLKTNLNIVVPSITNYLVLFADINNRKINNVLIKNLKKHNLNYKIRDHSLAKIPLLIICGKKEVDSNTVTIRRLDSNKQENMELNKFLKKFSALNKASSY